MTEGWSFDGSVRILAGSIAPYTFAGATKVARLTARKGANGLASTYLMVWSSVLVMSFLGSAIGLQSKVASVSRLASAWIWSVLMTSSAVIGLPSDHLASVRILTVQVRWSAEMVGRPSARSGTMFRFLSAWYRLGNMNWKARTSGTVPASNGFKVWASASSEYTRVPPLTGPDDALLVPQAGRTTAAVNDMTANLSIKLGRNCFLLMSSEGGVANIDRPCGGRLRRHTGDYRRYAKPSPRPKPL